MARRHIMESTFRLNLLNPQHAKINEVIKGLNPKIYKSKNQFLIEACEFYIDHYGEDDIPSKEEKRYEQFVTRDEIEKIKKEIFRRYNSGITPLQKYDIDRAAYIDDNLSKQLYKKIYSDNELYDFLCEINAHRDA